MTYIPLVHWIRHAADMIERDSATQVNGFALMRDYFIDQEHRDLRMLVGKLCRKLSADDPLREAAEEYLRRTFKANEVIRQMKEASEENLKNNLEGIRK